MRLLRWVRVPGQQVNGGRERHLALSASSLFPLEIPGLRASPPRAPLYMPHPPPPINFCSLVRQLHAMGVDDERRRVGRTAAKQDCGASATHIQTREAHANRVDVPRVCLTRWRPPLTDWLAPAHPTPPAHARRSAVASISRECTEWPDASVQPGKKSPKAFTSRT